MVNTCTHIEMYVNQITMTKGNQWNMPLLGTNSNIVTIYGSSLHVLNEQEVYNPPSRKFNIYD
jgi:hypothetical protein